MSLSKLSELLDISIGRTPSRNEPDYWGKGYPWVSIRDLSSKTVIQTKEQITDLGVSGARCKLIPKGTLLFSFKLTIGKMAFAGCDLYTNEAIAAFSIKDKKKLNPEFLYFALQAATYGGSNQAVMGKTLNSKSLANIEIPVPPLEDQIRIAHLLGKVEALIAQRKQHLQQLDDLLKSVFLEMFGPSAPGYSGWPMVEIKELAASHKGAMRTGPFGSNLLHSEFTDDGEVAVLGIDNAVQNRFAWSERRYITNEKYKELSNYRIFPGDVIVTIMGTIGRSAVVPDDVPLAINTKHLAAITLNKDIAEPIFLSYSIHSSPFILNQFKSKNRGAIMSGLNLGLIKETKLKHPPIELQRKFAEIHARVDELKISCQTSITDLDALYGGLSHRAFKGELDRV
jgi:type I restriction enzyme S subunit